jgi:NAD(P)-dependent dehydrogenase (short-subunit alcohol dehydrogenase family)
MLALTGVRSRIATELVLLLPPLEPFRACERAAELPLDADRYLFAQGYLAGKSDEEITPAERRRTYEANFEEVRDAAEAILQANERARICVIGSESAFFGSFDGTYARSKAMLHSWVQGRRLKSPEQQLVCVSLGIVGDAGMTTRRTDKARLDARQARHPKRRFVSSAEAARLIRFVLYEDRGYLSGVVIRMNGGEGAWR